MSWVAGSTGRHDVEPPVLTNLLGGYFHLDRDLDHHTSGDVLQYRLEVDGTSERMAALVDDPTTRLSWESSRADRFVHACMTWIDREGAYGDRGFLLDVRAVVRGHLPGCPRTPPGPRPASERD